MSAPAVQGCAGRPGKGLPATALARILARRGVRVAPFRGQTTSTDARVVRGGEIGGAQRPEAPGAEIEPEAGMRSQAVVSGPAEGAEQLTEPWRSRSGLRAHGYEIQRGRSAATEAGLLAGGLYAVEPGLELLRAAVPAVSA